MRSQQDTALHEHQASCDPEHPPHSPGNRASDPAYHGSATGGRVLSGLTASRGSRPDMTNDFMRSAPIPTPGNWIAGKATATTVWINAKPGRLIGKATRPRRRSGIPACCWMTVLTLHLVEAAQ